MYAKIQVAQQLFQDQEGQSIGDLMPICGNRLCVCNGATAEMRKSYASRHCRGEADYTLLKRVNCEDTSPEAIKLVLEREMQEYVTDCRYGLFPMWQKEGVTVDEKQSNYIIWLRCRYKDYEVADCTAKIKISYNQVCKAVETYWWMYASAHCLACDEDGSCKFVSFEEHANFQHVYCKVINEFTTVNTTVPLTVELKEQVEKAVVRAPWLKPGKLFVNIKALFPTYSSTYWVKAKGPLYSYRKTIKKHLKDDEADVNYEKDSILHIREWVKENTFEKKKDFPEFNLYTVFVAAYEIKIDTAPPQLNLTREERMSWRPKHVVRVVLTSIAMALQFPLLQLKPSLHRYSVISADTTFKLSLLQLLKVNLNIVCSIIFLCRTIELT